MSILKSLDDTTNSAAEAGEAYVKSTKKYYELKVFQQLTTLSSYVLKIVLLGSLCVLGLIFIAIAGATALGNYFNNMALGYLIVGGIFFLLVLIIYLVRKSIDRIIIQKLSKTYFDS
ncbi:hypothetical protein [Cellulophaga sp. L1A9]|uniref:hypothetical protein n=1 Tax=Cellulophaga sp. L1A9 TaxID=2686362 RepID=UPI00131B4679|nr:hypothetical protein [Cellulophaga sp. L1A9]